MASGCRLFDRFHGSSYSRHVGYLRASTTRALPLRNCSSQERCRRRSSPPSDDFAAMAKSTQQLRQGGEKWQQYTYMSS